MDVTQETPGIDFGNIIYFFVIEHSAYCFHTDIPKHYFDPITYELMHNPVVLPSGHIVDKETNILSVCSI
jgi:hypothetical protein